MLEVKRAKTQPRFRETPTNFSKRALRSYRTIPTQKILPRKKVNPQNVLALVLAGGRGSRLKDLTTWRAKPAVPFGGKLRIIDFPLSNCLNSGLRHIGILTQYKAHSLIGHVQRGWSFLRREMGEYVELLPAQQRNGKGWYVGTADAIYQNLDIIRSHNPEYVLILAGDHVYKMNYIPMLNDHLRHDADLTIGSIEVPISEASSFGVLSVDEDKRVLEFSEKPENPQHAPDKPEVALASMGIYVFKTEFLIQQLILDAHDEESSHDFGCDIIPRLIGKDKVYSFPFTKGVEACEAYWRDVGTVDSYWRANIELIDVTPPLNLYDKDWPIWTHQEQSPPAKFIFNQKGRCGHAVDSMVSGGCIVSGAEIIHSLLSYDVLVNDYSVIKDSVLLPDVVIGESCRINRAVIDKGVKVPADMVIGEDTDKDAERFYVSPEGIVLVTADMLRKLSS